MVFTVKVKGKFKGKRRTQSVSKGRQVLFFGTMKEALAASKLSKQKALNRVSKIKSKTTRTAARKFIKGATFKVVRR